MKVEFKIQDGTQVSVQSCENESLKIEPDFQFLLRQFKQALMGAGFDPATVESLDYMDHESNPIVEFELNGTVYAIDEAVAEYISYMQDVSISTMDRKDIN